MRSFIVWGAIVALAVVFFVGLVTIARAYPLVALGIVLLFAGSIYVACDEAIPTWNDHP